MGFADVTVVLLSLVPGRVLVPMCGEDRDGAGDAGGEEVGERACILGGGVGRAEEGGELKKSAVRERVVVLDDFEGGGKGAGGAAGEREKGEAKKACVRGEEGAGSEKEERSEKVDDSEEDVLRWEHVEDDDDDEEEGWSADQ